MIKNPYKIISGITEPYDENLAVDNLTVPDTPLELKIKSLQNFIDAKIDSTEKNLSYFETSTLPDKDEKIYLATNALNVYKNLRKIEITDDLRFEFVEYVFNNGYLRSAADIDLKSSEIHQRRQLKIYNSKEYKRFYHSSCLSLLCSCFLSLQ